MKKSKLTIFYFAVIIINVTIFLALSSLVFLQYEYPYVAEWGVLLKLGLLCNIPALLSMICLLFRGIMNKWTKLVTIIVICLTCWLSCMSLMVFNFASPFGSKTEDINNYLVFDAYVDEMDYRVFPDKIPESATNVKYFYRYRHCVEADYDIYAEWKLSKEDFEAEKERILNLYPDAIIVANDKDGKYLDYRVNYQPSNHGYYYRFVSFSESTLEVRYVFAGTIDDGGGSVRPYFLEMDD